MRKTIGVTSILALAAVIAALAFACDTAAEKAAQQSAQTWLALIDAGRYGQSWSEAAELFKQAVTQSQWENAVKTVRGPLGRLQSRNLKSASYKRSLPGAPDGEYVVIQYATSFESKNSAIETITPMKDKDGIWRVSGYYIK